MTNPIHTVFPDDVDPAIVQDSNYRFTPADRQYIDEQIRTIEAFVLEDPNEVLGEANTTSNSGSGATLAKAKVGVDLPFKSLVAGSNVALTANTNDVTIAATAGGSSGEMQFHKTDGSFDGTSNCTVDQTTKEVTFKGLIYYPGTTHSGTTAGPFTALVTNATEPAIMISVPIRSAAHAGILQVVAQARYSSAKGTQIYLVPYTFASGTVTLGTAIDQTPYTLVDATCVLTFATHASGGVNYIDVKGSANGNTNWSGQVQLTMADTPS